MAGPGRPYCPSGVAVKVVSLNDNGRSARVATVAVTGDATTRRGLRTLIGRDYQVVPLADDLTMLTQGQVDEFCPVNWPAMRVADRFAGPEHVPGVVAGPVVFTGAKPTSGVSQARLGWLLGQLVRDGVYIAEQPD